MNEPEVIETPNLGYQTRRQFLQTLFGAAALPLAQKAIGALNQYNTAFASAETVLSRLEEEPVPVKIMILGDSNTVGSELQESYVQNRDPNGPDDFSYAQRLGAKLPFKCDINVIAQGGSRVTSDGNYIDVNPLANSEEFLSDRRLRQIKDLAKHEGRIDTLVMLLGTGDAIEQIPTATFIDNTLDFFKTILKSTRTTWDNLVIILPPDLEPVQLADGTYFVDPESQRLVREYRVALKETFKDFAYFIDISGVPDTNYLQKATGDNIHLNNSGQELIADKLANLINGIYTQPSKEVKRRVFGKRSKNRLLIMEEP